MLSNGNIILEVVSSLLMVQSFLLVFYIFCVIKKEKHTPIQLNWIAEALFLMGILQILIILKVRTFSLSHFLNFVIMLYYSLYMTRFNKTNNEMLQRIFTILAHLSFNALTVFFVVSVYSEKFAIRTNDLNVYYMIYKSRYLFLSLMSILMIGYSVISLRDENLKPSIKMIQRSLIFGNILILLSYVLEAYYPIIYIVYSIVMLATNSIIAYHIAIEKGRFIDE